MPSLESVAGQRSRDLQSRLDMLRKKMAAEQAELIAPHMLRALRDHRGISQDVLAKRLSQATGTRITQNDISRLERSETGRANRTLQLAASRYFRNLGYDADGSGASIFVPNHLS